MDSRISLMNMLRHSKDRPCMDEFLQGLRLEVERIGRFMIDMGISAADTSGETVGSICQWVSLSFLMLRRTLQYAETHRAKCELEAGIFSLRALLMFLVFWDGRPLIRYRAIYLEKEMRQCQHY